MTTTTAVVRAMEPFSFMPLTGKRVIHPGGSAATDRLLDRAVVSPGALVLDIGCGVGATAIRLAREYGAQVVAADIDLCGRRARRCRRGSAGHPPGWPRPSNGFQLAPAAPRPGARPHAHRAVPRTLHLDDVAGWASVCAGAGLVDIDTGSGGCPARTPRGLIADEGAGTPVVFGRARPARRTVDGMSWLMPRLLRVALYIGCVLVSAGKPGIPVLEAR